MELESGQWMHAQSACRGGLSTPASSPCTAPLQVWLSVKGFVCCNLLNSVGATWSPLIVANSFGLVLLLLVFIWIGRCVGGRSLTAAEA